MNGKIYRYKAIKVQYHQLSEVIQNDQQEARTMTTQDKGWQANASR